MRIQSAAFPGQSFNRTVYPTNNPQARVLRLDELKLFGEIAEGSENLCLEEL